MRPSAWLATMLTVAFAAAGTSAQSPLNDDGPAVDAPAPPIRVAVLLLAAGGLEPALADDLAELLIGEVAARGGVRILGRAEFQAQLGQGDDGTLECVSSMACMGRIGVQLRVREVVAGIVSRADEAWTFNLNRVNVPAGEIEGRVFREVDGGLEAVVDALTESVRALYERPTEPATLVLEASEEGAEVSFDGVLLDVYRGAPIRRAGLPPGQHEVRVVASGFHPYQRRLSLAPGATLFLEARLVPVASWTHPLLWPAIVGAGLSAGAAAVLAVLATRDLDRSGPAPPTQREVSAYYDARQREEVAAWALIGLGAIGVAVAVWAALNPGSTPAAEDTPVELAWRPGGMELRVGGRL